MEHDALQIIAEQCPENESLAKNYLNLALAALDAAIVELEHGKNAKAKIEKEEYPHS